MPLDDVAAAEPRELITRALAIGDPEAESYWELVRELQRRGDAPTFTSAQALCLDDSDTSRQLGLDVLAQLGFAEGRPFLEETLPVVFGLYGEEQSTGVLISAISALGHLHDARGLPYVIRHVGHQDENVRLAAAQALPGIAGEPPVPDAVAALVRLTHDDDSDVRDWATFGIGSQLYVDSEEIRDVLLARVDDLDGDTADEALVGLANRGDRRVVDGILKRLESDDVGNLVIEAAGQLPDQRYLTALYRLRDRGWDAADIRGSLLVPAINACETGVAHNPWPAKQAGQEVGDSLT